MSRRPSKGSSGTSLLHQPPTAPKKATTHGRSSSVRRGLSIDWLRPSGDSSFLPFAAYSSWSSYGPASSDERKHLELYVDDQDDHDGADQKEQDLYNDAGHIDMPTVRLQRRRHWERYLIVVLLGALGWSIFGHRSRQILEDVKVRQFAPRKHLVSSIPLPSFRANLLNGAGYVTSFPYGGSTNQIVEMLKLTHLARLLDRTAVLPEMKATWDPNVQESSSRFFDLDAFRYYTNVSVVEWRHVKMIDKVGTQEEQLSCWGWRSEDVLKRYNIKTQFWPPPGQLTVPTTVETSMTFHAIEVLASQPQDDWLNEQSKSMYKDVATKPAFPDKQMLCFDNLVHVPSTRFVRGNVEPSLSSEELARNDPVWSETGIHLKFSKWVNRIADELLLSMLGTLSKPYIGVHIKSTDLTKLNLTKTETFDAFRHAAQSVQADLDRRANDRLPFWKMAKVGGHHKLPVLFSIDSAEGDLINQLVSVGWHYIDHLEFATVPRYGGWYPSMLDAVLLSRAVGFVGTNKSPFSYLAARRVESWNDGITRIVG